MAKNAKHARAQQESDEITARPAPVGDEFAAPSREPGLPLDPDELGEEALRDIAQEYDDHAPPPLSLQNGAVTDAPMDSPNFEPGQTTWEHSVDVMLQERGDATTLREATWVREPDEPDEPEPEHVLESEPGVDLTSNVVREGSLFDREGSTDDETIAPEVRTDNSSPEHASEESE